MPGETLVKALLARGLTVTAAESCTGGRIAGAITAVSGSSGAFPGSFVTYCDRVKQEVLDVPAELLEEFGAVSEPVALAMAEGAAKKLGTDLALSATGYAEGPGDENHPGGTVFLGLWFRGQSRCEMHRFSGSREAVQNAAAKRALEVAMEIIES